MTREQRRRDDESATRVPLRRTNILTTRAISQRTKVVGAVGIAATLFLLILYSRASGWVTETSGLVAEFVVSGLVLWCAWLLPSGGRHRAIWGLIGGGLLVFGVGDIAWSLSFEATGSPTGTGFHDVLYLSAYVLVGTAVVRGVAGFGQLFDLRKAFMASSILAAGATAALYPIILGPLASGVSRPALERAIAVAYPLLDIWLLLMPAIALAWTLGNVAGGRSTWPWWWATGGALVMASSDVLFGFGSSVESSGAFGLADILGLSGMAMLAVGASVAVDVLVKRSRPNPAEARS
jgi:hypothetical protein